MAEFVKISEDEEIILEKLDKVGVFVEDAYTVYRILSVFQKYVNFFNQHNLIERYIHVGLGIRKPDPRCYGFEKEYKDSNDMLENLSKDFEVRWQLKDSGNYDMVYFSIIEMLLTDKENTYLFVYEDGLFKLYCYQNFTKEFRTKLEQINNK